MSLDGAGGAKPPVGDVTQFLLDWSRGDPVALEKLMPLVYGELRAVASRYLGRERPGHTLQPTALVHEVYLKLVNQRAATWKNRAHFFAIAAQAMRRILVDHARSRDRDKRGGAATRLVLTDDIASLEPRDVDVLALDGALARLGSLDQDQAKVVELRFFGGLTVEETAEVLESSQATVKREWRSAKAWLYRELTASPSAP